MKKSREKAYSPLLLITLENICGYYIDHPNLSEADRQLLLFNDTIENHIDMMIETYELAIAGVDLNWISREKILYYAKEMIKIKYTKES